MRSSCRIQEEIYRRERHQAGLHTTGDPPSQMQPSKSTRSLRNLSLRCLNRNGKMGKWSNSIWLITGELQLLWMVLRQMVDYHSSEVFMWRLDSYLTGMSLAGNWAKVPSSSMVLTYAGNSTPNFTKISGMTFYCVRLIDHFSQYCV